MIHGQVASPINWDEIKLVVFDVDGTLYTQRHLRMRMGMDLLLQAASDKSFLTLRIVHTYRKVREKLADEDAPHFESTLIEETACQVRCPVDTVISIVKEWLEERPLRHLLKSRYPGVQELFAGLKSHGKIIGIFSDYSALAKLKALELTADYIVAAGDPEIGYLKPNPRGLERLMYLTNVHASNSILIGDRAERDGLAAKRAGVHSLIRSSKPLTDWNTFKSYSDPLFAPMLDNLNA